MCCVFRGCETITEIDTSSFDTSAVEDLSSIVRECRSLVRLDAGNFDTTRVVDMCRAFYNCKSLSTLDISSWGMTMTGTEEMFFGCDSLMNLYTKDIDVDIITRSRVLD